MPDKRIVDDLSIADLERVLAIKKREERQNRIQRMKRNGRVIETTKQPPMPSQPAMQQSSAYPPDGISDAQGLAAMTIEIPPESVQRRTAHPAFEDKDSVETSAFKRKSKDDNRIWRMFVDRSLLLIEVAAVIGLVALGAALIGSLDTLRTETAAAQQAAEDQRLATIPTIEPTPQLQLANVVLPGGHTPPIDGRTQFNFSEIPDNLHAQLANQVFLPPDIARPEITDDTPLRVIIPDIGVDHTIVQGVDWNALQQGVGQLPNGVTPDDPSGNVVLAAHNDIYGEIFRYLENLEMGTQFQIQTRSGIYTYTIRDKRIVEPDDVHVMESQGKPMATLISCYPYQVNDQRIVIFADRVS